MEKLKEILGQLGLKFRFEVALVDKLDEVERRLYALEENQKKDSAAIRANNMKYSELLMIVKSERADARRTAQKASVEQTAYHD